VTEQSNEWLNYVVVNQYLRKGPFSARYVRDAPSRFELKLWKVGPIEILDYQWNQVVIDHFLKWTAFLQGKQFSDSANANELLHSIFVLDQDEKSRQV
jgi:hypothetical protein